MGWIALTSCQMEGSRVLRVWGVGVVDRARSDVDVIEARAEGS